MVITWHTDHFVIKTKSTPVSLGEKIEVGEQIIPGPGEYDIADIFIESLPFSETPRSAVVIRIEGVTLVWIPALTHALSEKSIEILDGVDVLLVPLSTQLNSDTAQGMIKALEPKAVIYHNGGTDTEISKGIQVEETKAFKLTSAVLPEEGIHFVHIGA
jgi:hypothetical protein